MKNLKFIFIALLALITIVSCKKKELAIAEINEAFEVTENSAKLSGEVFADKKSGISEYGVCWDTVSHPTLSNNKLVIGTDIGEFSITLFGLNASTTYYVRAYATNSQGTAYSNLISFETDVMDITTPGQVVNFEGYEYSTVVLGNGQEWMTKNLRNSNYANGDAIPNVQDAASWSSLSTGAWAHYNNDAQYEEPYGKLYNWYTVNDSRGICPEGWHVPSATDFDALIQYAGGVEYAATMFMNERGGERWTNMGMFNYVGQVGFWWSSTPQTAHVANGGMLIPYASPAANNGFAVRCIKD